MLRHFRARRAPFFPRRACLLGAVLSLFALAPEPILAALPAQPGAEAGGLAKFEPAEGCYIGAFIERDFTVQGDILSFEQLTKKKHASYFTYVGYGRPFPQDWVAKVKGRGAAPHIAFEPNDGLEEVEDGPYLRAWARDAARAGCPIFLRFASEMNGPWSWPKYGKNSAIFREKFALVSRVMKEEAPNVAMVWTPFTTPESLINEYYPGDEWVDWVGVNIYSVYVNNGDPLRPAFQKDPVDFLRFIYANYADRKPIHISEFAATIYCKGLSRETVDFAIAKMTRFYTALRDEFPRVKSVNWFVLDTIRAGLANNNYSMLDDGRVLARYRELVADPHFLSRVAWNPTAYRVAFKAGTTLGPHGLTLHEGKTSDETLIGKGAIAATIDQPFLRGLKNGDIVRGDIEMRVQLPLDFKPQGLLWKVDGRTVAITNTAPYRVSIPRARFEPGTHTASIVVLARDGNASGHASPTVTFELAP